jgi:hypothetical protein
MDPWFGVTMLSEAGRERRLMSLDRLALASAYLYAKGSEEKRMLDAMLLAVPR